MHAILFCLLASTTNAADTWSDVSPIISRHCSTCHHDAGSGPFPLLSHSDLAGRRRFIAEILRRKLMPPWLPGGDSPPLHDDRTMPKTERSRLIAWLDAGAPTAEGTEPVAITPPITPSFPAGTFTVPLDEPFVIPPETIENEHRFHQDTWCFVIPLDNEDPLRVRGIGWKTAAPQSVHTVTLVADDRGRGRKRDEVDPRVGFERDGDLDRDISGSLGGVGIGLDRMLLPPGFHWSIPAHSDLVAEVKYRPLGRALPLGDQAYLVPADDVASREVIAVVTGVNRLKVPAGEKEHEAEDRFTLPAAFDVIAVIPRARNECRSMRLSANLPDGTQRTLLDIPDWDAHFRRPYLFKSIQSLPAGTILVSRFIIDNTDGNPRNPYDPPEDLRIGRRTGVAGFTLLGAGSDAAASNLLLKTSQRVMDRRGSQTRPSRTPIPSPKAP